MHVIAPLSLYFNVETGEVVSQLVSWALGNRAGRDLCFLLTYGLGKPWTVNKAVSCGDSRAWPLETSLNLSEAFVMTNAVSAAGPGASCLLRHHGLESRF